MGGSDKPIKHMGNMLNYYHVEGVMKYKIFASTLKGSSMTWFKTLPDESVDSWKELCDSFTTEFTA